MRICNDRLVKVVRNIGNAKTIQYQLCPTREALNKLGKVSFLDFAKLDSSLTVGRSFCMLEDDNGVRLILNTPISGVVAEINQKLIDSKDFNSLEKEWIINVDSMLEEGEEEEDYLKLMEIAD